MKNKTTHYLLILDRSGSMSSCMNETISGFNEQLQMIRDMQQRHSGQNFLASLTTFNHQVEHPFVSSQPSDLKELTTNSYIPDGGTALLDAIGEGVMNLKARHGAEIENDEATAVVVIMTDGHENSSKVFDHHTIRRMIRELEATDKWIFSYMGATRDAVEVAGAMNIRSENAVVYSKDNIRGTLSSLAEDLDLHMSEKAAGRVSKVFLRKPEEKKQDDSKK